MNKKMIILVNIILVILLTGCNNDNETQDETKKIVSVADDAPVQEERKEEYPTVTEISKFQKPKESQEYNFETDSQYYMIDDYVCTESEENIYYMNGKYRVCVFNKKSQTVSYLCNKPECTHKEPECNSYFGMLANMFYYDNSLYILVTEQRKEKDDNQNYLVDLNMYKVSPDGSERTFVTSLYTTVCYDGAFASMMQHRVSCIQHRGYLYYLYDVGTGYDETTYYNYESNCIHRMNLETLEEDEKCVAYMPLGSDYQFLSLMGKGSYIYYVKTDEQGFGEVYRFNTESKVNEKINIGTIATEDLALVDNDILYKKQWESYDIYRYNPDTGKEEIFANLEGCEYAKCFNMYTDEKYVYVNCKDDIEDAHNYIVFDHDGNKKGVISGESHPVSGWYIMGTGISLHVSDENGEVYYADETQIESGNAEYIKVTVE